MTFTIPKILRNNKKIITVIGIIIILYYIIELTKQKDNFRVGGQDTSCPECEPGQGSLNRRQAGNTCTSDANCLSNDCNYENHWYCGSWTVDCGSGGVKDKKICIAY